MKRVALLALAISLHSASALAQTACPEQVTLSGNVDLRESIEQLVANDANVRADLAACGGGTVDLIETDDAITLTLVDGFGRTVIRRADDAEAAAAVVTAWIAANAASTTLDPFALPDVGPSVDRLAADAIELASTEVLVASRRSAHTADSAGDAVLAALASAALQPSAPLVLDVPMGESGRAPGNVGWHMRASAEGGVAATGVFSGLSGSACAQLGPACVGGLGQYAAAEGDRAWAAAATVEFPIRRGVVEVRPMLALGWGTAPAGVALATRTGAVNEIDGSDLGFANEFLPDAEVVESNRLTGVEAIRLDPPEDEPDDREDDDGPPPRPPWWPPFLPYPPGDGDDDDRGDFFSDWCGCEEDESGEEEPSSDEESERSSAKSTLDAERSSREGERSLQTGPRIDLLVPIEFHTRSGVRPAVIPAFGLGVAGAEGWSVRLGVGAAFGGGR